MNLVIFLHSDRYLEKNINWTQANVFVGCGQATPRHA